MPFIRLQSLFVYLKGEQPVLFSRGEHGPVFYCDLPDQPKMGKRIFVKLA